jgi:beta-barrel assembly-enhancing protease
MGTKVRATKLSALLMALTIVLSPFSILAQQGTKVTLGKNKYSVSDDVKLGQQAAAEVEKQMPILHDDETTRYVQDVGRRLVQAIPSEFQQSQFRYTFKVVNARDINAFALPGGPMYVNRGMIEAARNEGEMAGVMAHEISHVALRHGTTQATETQKYQVLGGIGAIAGAILGGGVGEMVSQGTQLFAGGFALKYSRKYETQADILGAQILARAGYDPRDLANMFRTIEQQSGGSRGPEWLSSHPNPGNRYERINQEAALLRVSNPTKNTQEFNRIRARLTGMPRARTSEEIARSGPAQNQPQGSVSPSGRVEYPSSRYRSYSGGALQMSYPDNWQQLSSGNSIWFAPNGAYGQIQGNTVFTHGVQVGVVQTQSRGLRQATDGFINDLAGGNPSLRRQGNYVRGTISGQDALALTLSNRSEATGQTEIVTVYTTLLRNGELFYMISVAPQNEYNRYQGTFQTILKSIRLNV